MEYVIGAIVGLAIGATITWVVMSRKLATEEKKRVEFETRASETEKRIKDQELLLAEAKSQLSDTFKALAGDTLKASSTQFLELAQKTLDATLLQAKGDLGKREEAIKGLVNPLNETLKRYEQSVSELEKNRQKAYGNLEQYLKSLGESNEQLKKETANLVTALRRPQVRGRWGEMTLRRVVELAGLVDHCDFDEQVTVSSDEGLLRPDLVVHLPAGREIVVDTKVPLDAYLEAMEADTEEARKAALARHEKHVRDHIGALSGKKYWSQFPQAPEFVVMFIPGESFLSAAVDVRPTLIEEGLKVRVVPATPTTLVSLLHAVAYGWRQEQLAKNAQEVSDLGRELYDRVRVFTSHLQSIGKGLRGATDSYNAAVGSFRTRILPSVQRFHDLGVRTGQGQIAEPETVDRLPDTLAVPKLTDGAEDTGE